MSDRWIVDVTATVTDAQGRNSEAGLTTEWARDPIGDFEPEQTVAIRAVSFHVNRYHGEDAAYPLSVSVSFGPRHGNKLVMQEVPRG